MEAIYKGFGDAVLVLIESGATISFEVYMLAIRNNQAEIMGILAKREEAHGFITHHGDNVTYVSVHAE